MDQRISLAAVIHALKRISQAMKLAWGISERDVVWAVDSVKQFLRILGVGGDQLADVDRFAGPIYKKLGEFQCVRQWPILLLADSMFLWLKPVMWC
jgi:hypothetical protein